MSKHKTQSDRSVHPVLRCTDHPDLSAAAFFRNLDLSHLLDFSGLDLSHLLDFSDWPIFHQRPNNLLADLPDACRKKRSSRARKSVACVATNDPKDPQ